MDHTKLAPCDLTPPSRAEGPHLPNGADPTSDPTGSVGIKEPTTAVDAVRYLFLARELRSLGEAQAADRWQAQATAWLERLSLSNDEQSADW